MSRLDQRTWEDVKEIAGALELTPFPSSKYDLFVDLDDGATVNYEVLELLWSKRIVVPDESLVTISKSGDGNHLYLRLVKPMEIPERAALQASLGSDLMREALAIVKLKLDYHEDAIIVFFETPEESIRVREWMEDMSVKQSTSRLLTK